MDRTSTDIRFLYQNFQSVCEFKLWTIIFTHLLEMKTWSTFSADPFEYSVLYMKVLIRNWVWTDRKLNDASFTVKFY